MRILPLVFVAIVSAALAVSGCASKPEIKQQAYAALPSHRIFEYEFPVVWKAVESAVRELKVASRDPKEVDFLDMKNGKIRERKLETDWVYSRSRDKYQEYSVNGSPRKIYLQARNRYTIVAKAVIGGTEVQVQTDEEIERLKADGSPDGYSTQGSADPSRGSDMVAKIEHEILSAAP